MYVFIAVCGSVLYIAGWSTRGPDTVAERVLAAVNTIGDGIRLDGPAHIS